MPKPFAKITETNRIKHARNNMFRKRKGFVSEKLLAMNVFIFFIKKYDTLNFVTNFVFDKNKKSFDVMGNFHQMRRK